MDSSDIAIVGGGLAAAAAAESYRKAGGERTVTIISQEESRPVHRPPLSKEYLRGEAGMDKVFVHAEDFYDAHGIDLRLGTRVQSLDLAGKRLSFDDGNSFSFGTLVLATGARPRRLGLPGGDLPGVCYLRSLASAEALKEAVRRASTAVVIGAGFIGMEVAAGLAQRGIACTVVEMAPRLWPQLVPTVTAEFLRSYYEARGVTFRFGAGVKALKGGDRVQTVVLDGGEVIPADVVIVGVGAVLNTELAEASGLAVDRGVVVDRFLRAGHPDVFAMGDIASFPDPIAGRMHVEHWDNALNQGRTVGQTLAGLPTPFDHVPYFFSDVFDLSLNMIGYPGGWDDTVVRGTPSDGKFTTVYIKGGEVRGVLMVNDDNFFGEWEELVRVRAMADGGILGDASIHPSELLEATKVAIPQDLAG